MGKRLNDYDEDSINLTKLCALGDLDGVKRLVMAENNVDIDDSDYDGRTPLHLACSEGHIEIVEFLVEMGLKNINPVDRWGNTPFDDASRHQFENIS